MALNNTQDKQQNTNIGKRFESEIGCRKKKKRHLEMPLY
jgi:hypothetical protein